MLYSFKWIQPHSDTLQVVWWAPVCHGSSLSHISLMLLLSSNRSLYRCSSILPPFSWLWLLCCSIFILLGGQDTFVDRGCFICTECLATSPWVLLRGRLFRGVDGAAEVWSDLSSLEQAANSLARDVVWGDVQNFIQVLFSLPNAQLGLSNLFSLSLETLAIVLLVLMSIGWLILGKLLCTI